MYCNIKYYTRPVNFAKYKAMNLNIEQGDLQNSAVTSKSFHDVNFIRGGRHEKFQYQF